MIGIKPLARASIDLVKVAGGGAIYSLTRNTPPGAYQALIRLFCLSGGSTNDFMHRVISAFDKGQRLPLPSGSLGVRSLDEARTIAGAIERDGYYVFDQRVPEEVCERLVQFALATPAIVRPISGASESGQRKEAMYDRDRPGAVRYDFSTDEVLNCPDVQHLMADSSILAVAQSYLRTTPVADVLSMWWHTAFSDRPDEEAGQFFHFDMDRIKWLKVFIYLTDVGPHNGPHCFVRGSHRTNGIPAELRSKGYSRISDAEVLDHFPSDQIVEFFGPRGTVIAEDTRGLHKGQAVSAGDRLMLQLQFSDSLFGGSYPRSRFRNIADPDLQHLISAHPTIYSNYVRR